MIIYQAVYIISVFLLLSAYIEIKMRRKKKKLDIFKKKHNHDYELIFISYYEIFPRNLFH